MLAIIYLLFAILLGDAICRRVLIFVSPLHRLATASLCGLLISSWWTYLCCRLFASTASPLLWGNIFFFVTALPLMVLLWRRPLMTKDVSISPASGSAKWDWVLIGIFLIFSTWMMFTTLAMSNGVIEIGNHEFPDFGSSLSIMQSFAVGHNFPTVLPHFSGEQIRYHFMFYFLAGDLEYLGFNLAYSNNILSIITMTSMLAIIMTLGRVLFNSRVVGRIAAVLFFFHGSLAFIPFYLSTSSWTDLFSKIWKLPMFLSSGLHYRGEDWGVWSQVVFLNQRHFASSIGLFLIVIIFLVMRTEKVLLERAAARAAEEERLRAEDEAEAERISRAAFERDQLADTVASEHEPEDRSDLTARTEGPETDQRDILSNVETEDILELPDLPPPPVDVPIEDEGVLPKAFESLSVEQESESEVPAPGNDAGIEGPNTEALSPADGEAIVDGETESAEADPTGTVNDDSFEQRAETRAPEKVKRSRSFSPLALFADRIESWWAVLFIGVVLGLLPLWNGAVFTTAFIVLAVIFVIFPIRRQLIVIAVVAGVLGAPQLWYLTSGTRPAGYSIIRFGYTIDDATVYAVIYYLFFTFGFKWLLMAVGLYFSRWIHRGLFLAFSALIGVAFSFRFSEEVLVNHKFLNIWLILANIFVAYGAVRLWNISIARTRIPMRLVTVVLLFLVTVGGFIDLFPIKNSFYIGVNYGGDRLVEWVTANTDPRAVFLSQRYINHQILMAGRRLFYGEPYYAWGAGYDTGKRDQIYRRMFESNDPREVFDLLKQNHIDFVAIDDAIRSGGPNARKSNESLYAAYFPLVFEDTENRYANIKIYKVTDELGSPNPTIPVSRPEPTPAPSPAETFSAFTGGVGTEPGHFAGPRGLAADDHGNIYVSDTGNSRIQEFDPEGKFITFIGTAGSGPGELRQPNGIAVDPSGNIYVADAMNQKLIKYGADGKLVSEWKGPDSGFYGPRDLAFGANKLLYIIDQGRTRVARFDPASEQFIVWGTSGDGDGQFNEATGITVGDNLVFVADAMNNRIQVFDLNGNFVRQWPVPVWEKYGAHYPDIVFDEVAGRLYVTSGRTNEVLSFSPNGDQLENVKPAAGTALENPSTLCISQVKDRRRLLILNTGGARITAVELEARKTK